MLFNRIRFFFFLFCHFQSEVVSPFCSHQSVISKGNISLFFNRNIIRSPNSIGFLLQSQINANLPEILFSDLSSGLTEAQPWSKFHGNSEPEFIFSECMKESSHRLTFKHPYAAKIPMGFGKICETRFSLFGPCKSQRPTATS